MMLAVLDHLWQSSLCFGAAGLLTLILRRNSARARYWVWFAASMKFLVPLAPLMSLGKQLAARAMTPAVMPTVAFDVGFLSQSLLGPFDSARTAPTVLTASMLTWQQLVLGLWALGVLGSAVWWAMRWRGVRLLVREARPLAISAPVPVRTTHASFEPGLIGIVRPALLLPEGLSERLSAEEMQAILAHEFCHLRRRDNLTFALHMITRTLFWFYPLTWWLGRRLVIERERACDEMVLAAGHDAGAYGASILKVCRFAVPGPLGFTAGVLGLDLKSRVGSILDGCTSIPMNGARKLLLAAAAAAPLIVPIGLGLLSPPRVDAQPSSEAPGSAVPTPAERTRLLAEQEQPQREVPFNPKDFDRFVGYYQQFPGIPVFFHIYRNADRYYSQITGQMPVQMFPESPSEFFATVVAAQLSFDVGPDRQVTGLVLHQNGMLIPWKRVSTAAFEAASAKLQQHIKNNVPSSGTEAALRHQIATLESGEPDYSSMGPGLAEATRQQLPQIMDLFRKLGALKSLTFSKVLPDGADLYLATFEHGQLECTISPLLANGKVTGDFYHPLP